MRPSEARAALDAALQPVGSRGGLSALLRRRAVVLAAAVAALLLVHAQTSLFSSFFGPESFEPLSSKPDWLLGASASAHGVAVGRTVVYEADVPADPNLPLVSLVLPLGSDAVGGIQRFLHAVLATTVGPYELIVVLSESTPDAARAIDEAIMPRAL